MPKYVDFGEGGKPEYPEKNPRSTGEINYGNPTHMKYHTRLGFSGERHNGLTACVNNCVQEHYVTINEGEARINYHHIEIGSE